MHGLDRNFTNLRLTNHVGEKPKTSIQHNNSCENQQPSFCYKSLHFHGALAVA